MADSSIARQIAQLLERFMILTDLVDQIPGHPVVLTSNRVRFRPALPYILSIHTAELYHAD